MTFSSKVRHLIAFSFIFIHICATSLFALEDKDHLVGQQYIQAARQLISEAQASIDIYMYFIIADDSGADNPINLLLADLIKARQRGVAISITLEDRKMNKSKIACQRLTPHGIDINFNFPSNFVHSKDLIVDNRHCITGSTNWSRAAILYNHETGIYLDSREFALAVKKYYAGLKTTRHYRQPLHFTGIPIPRAFLLDPKLGPRLFKDHAAKAFALYLYLLKKSHQAKSVTVTFSYQEIAFALGYPPYNRVNSPTKNENEYYHLKIRKPFQALKHTYQLIEYHTLRDRKTTLIPIRSEKSFILPDNYWNYHYATHLSFRAKYMYLIFLLETQRDPDNSYLLRSHKGIARTYHLSTNPVSLGLLELEKNNIIEITRSTSIKGVYEGRDVNVYRLRNLISPEEFQSQIAQLEKKYGKKITGQAVKLSAQLDEPQDIEKIKIFINLIQKYGYAKVATANRHTSKRKKGTAFHSIENTITLLKTE